MPKARKPRRGRYLVALDYATKDLLGTGLVDQETGEPIWDGKGGVSWQAGAVIELDPAAAAWVNEHKPGTLEDYREAADPDLDEQGAGDQNDDGGDADG